MAWDGISNNKFDRILLNCGGRSKDTNKRSIVNTDDILQFPCLPFEDRGHFYIFRRFRFQ